MQPKIITQLKKANLTGRGGAGFSTWKKWDMVLKESEQEKYVVCNLSEGEPGVFKDEHILKFHTKEMIGGIDIALKTFKAKKAYIYTNPEYFKKYKAKLEKVIGNKKIEVFNKGKGTGYVGGEETSALNNIEGKRIEPRLRPPFPVSNGLFGKPTLINNCETFYHIYLVSKDKYDGKRFFSLSGDVKKKGIFELPEKYSVEKILRETGNYPKFDFFVQIGGGLCGEVLNSNQLNVPVCGAGTILVFNNNKTDKIKLLKSWIEHYANETCGQCVPCREGTYRLREAMNKKNPDFDLIVDICHCMQDSSLCALGGSAAVPILSLIKNVGIK